MFKYKNKGKLVQVWRGKVLYFEGTKKDCDGFIKDYSFRSGRDGRILNKFLKIF